MLKKLLSFLSYSLYGFLPFPFLPDGVGKLTKKAQDTMSTIDKTLMIVQWFILLVTVIIVVWLIIKLVKFIRKRRGK